MTKVSPTNTRERILDAAVHLLRGCSMRVSEESGDSAGAVRARAGARARGDAMKAESVPNAENGDLRWLAGGIDDADLLGRGNRKGSATDGDCRIRA